MVESGGEWVGREVGLAHANPDIAPATLPNTHVCSRTRHAHIHRVHHRAQTQCLQSTRERDKWDVFHHRSLCLTEADELVLSFAESDEFILAFLQLLHILDRTAFAKADELILAFAESDKLVLFLLHRFARLLL